MNYIKQTDGLGRVQCGNPDHPLGPWHDSTPLPLYYPFWRFRKNRPVREYRRNEKRWGCGCSA